MDIFETLNSEDKERAESVIRDLIITTDIGNKDAGAKMTTEWEQCCTDVENYNIGEAAHRIALARALLLCADIGIVAERVEVYVPWLRRLYDEVKQMDSNTNMDGYYNGQCGFLAKYAKPLFERVAKSGLVPQFDTYLERLQQNQTYIENKEVAISSIESVHYCTSSL